VTAGAWVAPPGIDSNAGAPPPAILPIGGRDEAASAQQGRTGSGAVACLATADAEALIQRCTRTAALLPELATALAAQAPGARGRLFDLTDYPAEDVTLIGQVLGKGEVAAIVALPDGIVAQVQESVLAGLWRVRFLGPEGSLVADYLEVAAIPEAVTRAASLAASEVFVGASPQGAMPAGTMNALPVLVEIRDRMGRHRSGDPSHVITLSLLPMTEADLAFLQDALGTGPVSIVSRGYGTCRVVATGARHVWSVQHFNASDTLVLDTIEIGDVPAVALAAAEDFQDSAERLKDIADAYFA
jgi:hydrogenase-1 operon protein HyaF